MSKNLGAYDSKGITPAYASGNIGKRQLTQTSDEVERITKNVFKDDFGRFSDQFSKNHKAEVFVDKSTGRTGFKEEIKYKLTKNFDDKIRGCSSKYETEVKFKKEITFPSESGSKSATLPKSSYSPDNSTTSKDYGTTDTGDYDDESGYEAFDDCHEDVDHGYSEDDYDDEVDYGSFDDE